MTVHIHNPSGGGGGAVSGSTAGLVPYVGAVADVELGIRDLNATIVSATTVLATTTSATTSLATTFSGTTVLATTLSGTTLHATTLSGGVVVVDGVTSGVLQGVTFGTGGSLSAVATGGVGQFLYHVGGNTYAWVDTAAQAGLGTDVVIPYLGAVSDTFLGAQDIQATIFSGNTVNAGTLSGGVFLATGITDGTIQGIVAGTGGSFFSIGSTGGAGQFLYSVGNNTYAWANTQAPAVTTTAGLVPYSGATADVFLATRDIGATIFSGGTVLADVITGGTVLATAITAGTFQGILMGTGGSVQAIGTTGVVGQFLHVSGGNTYSFANTATAGDVSYSDTRFKVVSWTINQAAITATQSVTGVGFTPIGAMCYANQDGTIEVGYGMSDGSTHKSIKGDNAASNLWGITSNFIVCNAQDGNQTVADIQSFTSDGFIAAVSTEGTPSGTQINQTVLWR